jgi:hypothetical protein
MKHGTMTPEITKAPLVLHLCFRSPVGQIDRSIIYAKFNDIYHIIHAFSARVFIPTLTGWVFRPIFYKKGEKTWQLELTNNLWIV